MSYYGEVTSCLVMCQGIIIGGPVYQNDSVCFHCNGIK